MQLLDLPGIVEGAAMGRGRGRQVVSVAKTADVIVIMSEYPLVQAAKLPSADPWPRLNSGRNKVG